MAAKVEQSSDVESRIAQSPTAASTSSAASANSPKVSMFGAKSGFVIPKNKLSGRLVPMFRGSGKADASEAPKEEGNKQVQRKTKWGVDLTQDASVRRGRALAYQTRVDQITKQLKSGALEIGEDQSLQSPAQVSDQDSSSHQTEELEKLELLELEKREAIGEILRLNPSYKAPADYMPVLKEAKVPIPLKAYPGYNFIRLLLGPESNTQKRLEEETGAKIRVQCTKADTGEKKDITLPDGDDTQADYEELYVHISAETFEKVDVAVALIELLVTPVSGSSVPVSTSTSGSGDHVNVGDQVQGSAASYMMPVAAVNQSLVQPMGSVPSSHPLAQFQSFSGPWGPHGPPNPNMHPPSGFIPPPNLVTMSNNSIRFPPPMNPFNTIPYFGVRPLAPAAFGSVLRSPSFTVSGPQPPLQVLQRPFVPETRPSNQATTHQNHPMQGLHPQLAYPATPTRSSSPIPSPFTANQPMPTGSTSALRPPAVPSIPHPVSAAPSGQPPNQLSMSMHAAGNSSGWSGAPPNIPPPLRPSSNMMQMIPPSVSQSSRPTAPQSFIPSNAQSSMPGTIVGRSLPLPGNAVPPGTFVPQPSTPQLSTPHNNQQAAVPTFASGPHVGAPSSSSSVPMSAPPMLMNSVAPPSGALLGPAPRPLLLPTPMPGVSPVFSQAPTVVNASSPSVLGQAPSPIQPSSMAPMQPVMARAPVSISSSSSAQASAQVMPVSQSPLLPAPSSVSGNIPSFSPMKPPMTSSAGVQLVPAPKPQRPSSSDFTFQPQRPQRPTSPSVPRPTSQAVAQNAPTQPPSAVQLPSASQAHSFRPAMNNSAPQTGTPAFSRLPSANQMGPTRASIPPPSPNSVASFSSNQANIHPSLRVPSFPNPRAGPPASPTPQMGPPSFLSAPQVSNPRSPLPTRPGNQLLPTNRPGSLMVQNQQLGYVGGRPISSPSGGNQIYDPFSPTSISSAPQQQGGRPVGKQETDAEYEDLMASVGVR